jgi:hypothetical protein
MENLRQTIADCDTLLSQAPAQDTVRWQEAAKTRAQRERMLQTHEEEWLELASQLEQRRKQFFDHEAVSNRNEQIAEF